MKRDTYYASYNIPFYKEISTLSGFDKKAVDLNIVNPRNLNFTKPLHSITYILAGTRILLVQVSLEI